MRPTSTNQIRLLLLVALLGCTACGERETPRQYVLAAQVLAVHPDRMELTIHHDDIPDLMRAMTMTYPVSDKRLLDGRVPGETITATLEVRNASGRLVSITHTGIAPLPTADQGGAGGLLAVGDQMPDAAFVDQGDRRRSLAEWKGAFALVTFMETRCLPPDACARISRSFAALQRTIVADSALSGRLRLVSLTLDPVDDTPARLAVRASAVGADPAIWTWLTGDAVTVQRVAGRFGLDAAPGSDGASSRSRQTVLIDPDGRIRQIYDGDTWTPAVVLADVRAAKEVK